MWQHVIKILTICCFSWINGYHKFCKIEIMKEQYTENEKNSLLSKIHIMQVVILQIFVSFLDKLFIKGKCAYNM